MTDNIEIKEAKEKLRKFMQYRNRHSGHVVGEVLYYECKDISDWRKGVVHNVIPHFGMKYYVLEVLTGPPINESFLKLVSEFTVKSEGEV